MGPLRAPACFGAAALPHVMSALPAASSGWSTVQWRVPPLVLLAGSLLLALRLGHTPQRLAITLWPYVALYGLSWVALEHFSRPRFRDLTLLLLTAACVLPAFATLPPMSRPSRAQPLSEILWSVTLPQPEHALMRRIRVPDAWKWPGAQYRLVVRLERPYPGPAELLATVNDVSFGAMPAPIVEGEPALEQRQVIVPAEVLAQQAVTTIVLRQSAPDAGLRIITYGRASGATLGADGTRYFDGSRWITGVLQPATGRVVPGTPHVLLIG